MLRWRCRNVSAKLYIGEINQKYGRFLIHSVSTDNTYAALNKRKWNNIEPSDLQINEFICSSLGDKLNLIFQELRFIRGNQEHRD